MRSLVTRSLKSEKQLTLEKLKQVNLQLRREVASNRRMEKVQDVMLDISNLSLSPKKQDKFYQSLQKHVSRLFYARNFLVALKHQQHPALHVIFQVDEKETAYIWQKHIDSQERLIMMNEGEASQSKSLSEYVYCTGKPLLLNSECHETPIKLLPSIKGAVDSWLGVPLTVDNEIFGVLVVQSYCEEHQYNDTDKELMMYVSRHLSHAVAHQNSIKQVHDLYQELASANLKLETRVKHRTEELNKSNQQLKEALMEQKRIQKILSHQAHHDSLTGLYNREYFTTELEKVLESTDKNATVYFMDLDRFKLVNDSLGHIYGDALLREVAFRLQHTLASSSILARLGGDEFCILVTSFMTDTEKETLAHDILRAMRRPFNLQLQTVTLSISIGICQVSEMHHNAVDILRDADAAMYAAKASGKNTFRFANDTQLMSNRRKMLLESELYYAVQYADIQPAYQPIVNVETGKVTSIEALARWDNKRLGPISPEEFIPVAEESGLIIKLGQSLMEQSLMHLAQLHKQGLMISMHINVSSRQLEQPMFVKQVGDLINKLEIPPKYVYLELTETWYINNLELAKNVLCALADLGIRIALDDFGTGFSSLTYLQDLPFSCLKLDRSFVAELHEKESRQVIVHSINQMAKAMKIPMIAEGVENAEEYKVLKEMGVNQAQGFYLGQAMDYAVLHQWLKNSEKSYA